MKPMNLVLYIDGTSRPVAAGSGTASNGYSDILGWGIVGLLREHTIERAGSVLASREASSDHEMLALVQAVRLTKDCGISFANTTIFTDDETVAYAAYNLHPGNECPAGAERVLARLARAIRMLDAAELEADCLECLRTARFVKVKSHSVTVYNNRADYLANRTARRFSGLQSKILDFDAWLARGFVQYCRQTKSYTTWFAPFSQPEVTT